MKLTKLSNSGRDTFKQCGLKYLLEYEDKVPDMGDRSALNFGSFIHRIFEEGVKAKSVEELEAIGSKFRKEYPFDNSYNGKIKTCLKNFLRFNASLQETVGIELVFTIPLVEGVAYNGIIDRVIKAKNGDYLVIDYKTSKHEKTKLDLYEDNQLRGYVHALSVKYKVAIEKVQACHYYPLTDNLVRIKYTGAQIRGFLKELEKEVSNIQSSKKEDLVPHENEFCRFCTKRYYCSLFNSAADSKKRIEEGIILQKNKSISNTTSI